MVYQQLLPLTGERTVPGIDAENYWFQRHLAVYQWIINQKLATGEVLEAGCGEGYGAEMLRTSGCTVTAYDYDESVVDHVRSRYPQVEAMQANLDQLPASPDSFQAVVSLQVIEHLWNLGGFLNECHRVTKSGGVVALSTPNRITFSPGVGRGEKPTNPFHVEEFDAEQMDLMMKTATFDNVQVYGLSHGPALTELEAREGSLVQRQIDAVLAEESFSPQLLRSVSSVTSADFEIARITPGSLAANTALDLIVTASKP